MRLMVDMHKFHGKIPRTALIGARMAGDIRKRYITVAIMDNKPLMIMWCDDPRKAAYVMRRWFTLECECLWADDVEFPHHINLQPLSKFEEMMSSEY